MIRCGYDGCGWVAIAPSRQAAREQYDQHIVAEHVEEVDVAEKIPEGMVQVKVGEGDWETMTPEEAKSLHDDAHDPESE